VALPHFATSHYASTSGDDIIHRIQHLLAGVMRTVFDTCFYITESSQSPAIVVDRDPVQFGRIFRLVSPDFGIIFRASDARPGPTLRHQHRSCYSLYIFILKKLSKSTLVRYILYTFPVKNLKNFCSSFLHTIFFNWPLLGPDPVRIRVKGRIRTHNSPVCV
jgi:hypothetical protein